MKLTVIDSAGIKSLPYTKSIKVKPSPFVKPPIIVLVDKDSWNLNTHYLQGSEVIIDSVYSKAGEDNASIQSVEWFDSSNIIGSETTFNVPTDVIGEFNYRVKVTNSLGGVSDKDFKISISPDILPQVQVIQPSHVVPSDVVLSLENLNEFIGPREIKWKNTYTNEEYLRESVSTMINHVGETIFIVNVTDSFGYVYNKEVVVEAITDTLYIEGETKIDVVIGAAQSFKYLL